MPIDTVVVDDILQNIFSPTEVPAEGPGMYHHENYTTRPSIAMKKPRKHNKSVQEHQWEDTASKNDTGSSSTESDSESDTPDSGKNVLKTSAQQLDADSAGTSTQKDQDHDEDNSDEENDEDYLSEHVSNGYPDDTDGYLCYRCLSWRKVALPWIIM